MNINDQLQENGKKSRKTYWKFVGGFFAIIILAFVVFPLVKDFFYTLAVRKDIREYFEWEKAYQADLKNDIFGGETPQETYAMFIETLKNGDILSAAKFYYRDEDRITWYKKFDEMQKSGELENWINEQPEWESMKEVEYWHEEGKKFVYQFVREKDIEYYNELTKEQDILSAGVFESDIIFLLNKEANIWKIYQ